MTYDYSRLKVWGSRAYAINHLNAQDYGTRSEPGIYVGMDPSDPITVQYEIYLPHKDIMTSTGDAIFCEHTTRTEPERLLPPSMEIMGNVHDASKFQYLVDTVHFDTEEGITYKVLRVYSSRGLVQVDRVIYDVNDPHQSDSAKVDTVHLLDILNMPILQGHTNPAYQSSVTHATLDDATAGLGSHDREGGGSARQKSADVIPQSSSRRRVNEMTHRRSLRLNSRDSSISAQQVLTSVEEEEDWHSIKINTFIASSLDISNDYWSDQPIFAQQSLLAAPNEQQYTKEPKHYGEAMSRLSERMLWKAGQDLEVDSLNELEFADIVDILETYNLLPCMWVYKYKRDHTGVIKVYKCRIVIRGDFAIKGIDFFDTYAPVAKIESVRIVLALIIKLRMKPCQFDIVNAFVQSKLDEDVYMSAIPGYPLPQGKCYKLNRSLYGLPQASKNWNNAISIWLIEEMNFVQLKEDYCIFILIENAMIIIILTLYVDDGINGFDTIQRETWFLHELNLRFKTKVIGLPSNILGLHITWKALHNAIYFESVSITNTKSLIEMIKSFGLEDAKPIEMPYNESQVLSKTHCPNEQEILTPECKQMQKDYKRLVGALLWVYTTVRVDVSYIMLILCSFVANPGYEHFEAASWLLRYLYTTSHIGLTYRLESSSELIGWADADNASHESRRSIYMWLFTLAGSPISWKNGFNDRISLSTCESETRAIHAMREALKHVMYLKKFFTELQLNTTAQNAIIAFTHIPQLIMEDNAAAIRYSLNPASQSSMKYLETDIYWIQEAIQRKEAKLVKIAGHLEQLADIGTKKHKKDYFLKIRDKLFDVTIPDHE